MTQLSNDTARRIIARLGSAKAPGPVNGIRATHRHDEGAYARCSYCGRYSLDPATLGHHKVPACECGEAHGWSGSFRVPTESSRWSGRRP
jgi:hypothetical protein